MRQLWPETPYKKKEAVVKKKKSGVNHTDTKVE